MRSVFILLALLFALPINAIVIRHDRHEFEHLALAKHPIFSSVVLLHSKETWSTGTFIDPRTIITTGHGVPDVGPVDVYFYDINMEKKFVLKGESLRHGGYYRKNTKRGTIEELYNDVALVILPHPVRHLTFFPFYYDEDVFNELYVSVGFGALGTGVDGPRYTKERYKRAFTNRIEDIEYLFPKKQEYYISSFENPTENSTDLEGIGIKGDSGGPILVQRDGNLHFVGINSMLRRDGKYGSCNYILPLKHYKGWIQQNQGSKTAQFKGGKSFWECDNSWFDDEIPFNGATCFNVKISKPGELTINDTAIVDTVQLNHYDATLTVEEGAFLSAQECEISSGQFCICGTVASEVVLKSGCIYGSGTITGPQYKDNYYKAPLLHTGGVVSLSQPMKIEGDYHQEKGAIITWKCPQAILSIDGTAHLAGNLIVELSQLLPGQSYTLLEADSIEGAFQNILFHGETLNSHELVYSPTKISLHSSG